MPRSRAQQAEVPLGEAGARETRKPARRRGQARRTVEASFVCDRELAITAWTAEAERMFGWTAGEVLGRPFFDLLQTDFLHIDRAEMMRRLRHAKHFDADVTHACRDGRRLLVELRMVELQGAGAEPGGLLCDNRAVGHGRATSLNGVELGRPFLEQIPGMFWVADEDLRFLLSSGTVLTRLGLGQNRWIGKTVAEFFATADPDFPAVRAHRAALAGRSESYDVEWHGRILRCHVGPFRNAGGRIVGVIGGAEDATAQVHAQEELNAKKTLLETIIQQAAEGISVCDADGRFTLINDAARDFAWGPSLGRKEKVTLEEASRGWRVNPGAGASPDDDLPISKALRGERTIGRALEVTRPDGSRFVARVSAAPIRNAAGEIVAAVASTFDFTAQKETERALREQKELLQLVLDNIGAGVIVVDDRHHAVVFNPAARHILRERPTGDLREDWGRRLGVYHPDRVTPYTFEDLPLARALRGEAADVPEIFILNENVPEGVWVRSSSRPLIEDDGTVRGAVVVFHDISERKRIQEHLEARVLERTAKLEENRRLLQDIVDNTTAIIYLKDTEGRYLLINAQYERIFHFSKQEAVGKTDYDLIGPEWAPALRANDALVLETGHALQFEETVLQDDGPHTYVSVKFPLHDADGKAFGVCGISTDITERQRIETELRRSEGALSALIESSTDAIWSVDRDLRISTMNSVVRDLFERQFGVEPHPGDQLSNHVPVDVWEHWESIYERAIDGERFVVEESVTIDGAVRSFVVSMAPVVGQGGAVVGATAFAKDITDLKRAEEELRRNQADLAHVLRVSTVGEMAAGFAHEINQPLCAIRNYASGSKRRIESGLSTPAEILDSLDEIGQQARRAAEIIRRLRDLVHKREVRRERVDVNDLVAQAVRVVASEAERSGVAITQELAASPLTAAGDSIQIQQVVLNLLLNGIEAMASTPEGSRVLALRTAKNGDEIEIEVSDRGGGLLPATAACLFEPFRSTKPEGLGMGLAISRRIVEAHGGQIWVAATSERGTTFRFTLPAGV
jgi:PAS domain S-box-containing protein